MIKRCLICNDDIEDSYDGHGHVDVLGLDLVYQHSICPRCALYGFKKHIDKAEGYKPSFAKDERKCQLCGKMFTPNSANQKVCDGKCRTAMFKVYKDRAKKKARKNNVAS